MPASKMRRHIFLSLCLLVPLGASGQERAELPVQMIPSLSIPDGYFSNPMVQASELTVEKPTGQAFLKSLLLPGWGELSAGESKRGRSFLIAEGVLWSAFTAFRIYGNWKRNDLENFAVEKAGVNTTSKAKTYYTDVSNFQDIYEHNEEMRRFRRYDDVYPVDEDNFWQWTSKSDQERFDELRLSSSQALRNSTLVVGAVLINHVLSAIDAIYVTSRYNRRISAQVNIDTPQDYGGDLRLNFALSANW